MVIQLGTPILGPGGESGGILQTLRVSAEHDSSAGHKKEMCFCRRVCTLRVPFVSSEHT